MKEKIESMLLEMKKIIDSPHKDHLPRIKALEKEIDEIIKLRTKVTLNLNDLVESFNDVCDTYSKEFPDALPFDEMLIFLSGNLEIEDEEDEEKKEENAETENKNSDPNLQALLQATSGTITDEKQIIHIDSKHVTAVMSVQKYLTYNPNKIETDKLTRIQRKLNTNLLTPLSNSFEIRPTEDGYILYILLKTKSGNLNARGAFKRVKACLRFYKGQWELWANRTVKQDQIDKLHQECIVNQIINSKHIVKLEEGSAYRSSPLAPLPDKASVYMEKADGTLDKAPSSFRFSDFFSLCLTSTLGLADIHKAGFIHRDIKFQNILFFQKLNLVYAKISDLGFTIEVSKAKPRKWAGTLNWASPEEVLGHQLNKKHPTKVKQQCEIIQKAEQKQTDIKPANIADQKGDVYALAKAFYEIFTAYSNKTTASKEQKEALSLAEYFQAIMQSSREARVSSAEMVAYLTTTLNRLSVEMPGMNWSQIAEYCEIPLKPSSSILSKGSDEKPIETPLRALSMLKSDSAQFASINLHSTSHAELT